MRSPRLDRFLPARALGRASPRLDDLSLEGRLRLVVVLTAAMALLIAGLGFGVGEVVLGQARPPRETPLALRAAWYAAATGLALLLATALGFSQASRIRRAVSDPARRMLHAVHRVARDKDYSVRVEGGGRDEMGQLIEGLNEMLRRVERNDADREAARRELVQQARDLARSNSELDDFAYVASHDMKEPLRGIHNYARFLLEDYGDAVDAEGVKKLETLIRLTERMETLVDTLLHYSRLGRTDQSFGATDLDAVLHEVLEAFGPSFEAAAVEVRIPRPLPRVLCDSVRVAEIFRNLIGNAIKYNDGPQPWIEIQWGCGVDPSPPAHMALEGPALPDHPVFTIRDNGIGIRERHLSSVFRIFKRLHGRDRFGGGTGAGLSIVEKIVERHGGRLWVESRHGEGTAFCFSVGALLADGPGKEG